MGCNWSLSWSNAKACVKEAASTAWDWLKDNPDVIVVWAGAAGACIASYGSMCGPAINAAWGYTLTAAREDIKAYAEEKGEAALRKAWRVAINTAYEAVEQLFEDGEINSYELTRLKDAIAAEAEEQICPLPEDVKTYALHDARAVSILIYQQYYARSDIDGLVDRGLSEISYRSEAVREAVGYCPGFIGELRAELTRHFVRWGAARTREKLPGREPPPTLVERLTQPIREQTQAIERMREMRGGWGDPQGYIESMKKIMRKPRTTSEAIERISTLKLQRRPSLAGAGFILAFSGLAIWAARK